MEYINKVTGDFDSIHNNNKKNKITNNNKNFKKINKIRSKRYGADIFNNFNSIMTDDI